MTRSDDNNLPETLYVRAMSVLRQAPKGTSDALMDKLLLAFIKEADLALQKAKTKKKRQKLYIASITALIDYLNVRGMPHEVLSAFLAELSNRASGFKGQFTFDAEIGGKSQTLEYATQQALVLAYHGDPAFLKDNQTVLPVLHKYNRISESHPWAIRPHSNLMVET